MNRFFLVLLLIPCSLIAQQNCSNPLIVNICPTASFIGHSNAGMGDDAPAAWNITGEDRVYEIRTPASTRKLFIQLNNVSAAIKISLSSQSCTDSLKYTTNLGPGNSSLTYFINPAPLFYLWIDAANTISYDIAIGADTGSYSVNTPNTQGNLLFDSCASVPFNSSKAFFEVRYNGIYQFHPMTLAPLNSGGLMCVDIYLQNTSGVSGPKDFLFEFKKSGFSSASPANSNFAGYYAPGNWVYNPSLSSSYTNATKTGVYYSFTNTGNPQAGDIVGSPNSCLRYNFCFNITPISNDPVATNIIVSIYSDLNGRGFSGSQALGCCTSPGTSCLGLGGFFFGGTQGLGFGFNDPGNGSGLPVSLKSFTAKLISDYVQLDWTSASETNNAFYSIERSSDAIHWETLLQLNGAGTISHDQNYTCEDRNPLTGISYYRLRQTDYDGHSRVFPPVSVHFQKMQIKIYPLPAKNELNISGGVLDNVQLHFSDLHGREIQIKSDRQAGTIKIDTQTLSSGMYVLQIFQENEIIQTEKIIIE